MNTRRPPEERRRQIFDATGRLMLRDGIGAVTMIAVAEESGLSRRLLYDHFADLDTLLRDYVFETLARALTPDEPWAVLPAPVDNDGDVPREVFRVIMSLDAEQRTLIQLIRAPKLSTDLTLARAVVEHNAVARWRRHRPLAELTDDQVLLLAGMIIDLALDLAEAVDAGLVTVDVASEVVVAATRACMGELQTAWGGGAGTG